MTKKKRILLIICGCFAVYILSFFGHVLYMKVKGDIYSGIEFSSAYCDRKDQLLQTFLTSDDKYRIYEPLSAYPPEFIEAILLQEDRYFYKHIGINPVAIIKAGWETYIKRSRRMGASTITMQVAKLKYGIYTKNIFGKLKQIRKAIYLELCFTKDEILEAYLNLAPCGSNIEGFATASWYYFHKNIKECNLSENIMLCVLPQNPIKRAPTPELTPSEMITARKVLFSSWVEKHPEDADKEVFMDMQLSVYCNFPNEVRHFTEMLNQMQTSRQKAPLSTTINLDIQKKCEELFDTYINQNKHFGVNNGALLLLDWTKMEVVANIGSANYYDDSILGMVNLTTSKRSPGSTLKPFIYAMALDQGLIHYRTMLKDTPVTFNEYSPDNYGSIFKGPVQAWFALDDSRNIPAIALEQQLSSPDLYDFMVESGITNMEEKDYYGLSIVLGTCDVTMLELVKMYGTLCNNGIQKEIRFYNNQKIDKGKRLLSEESSFIVRKMLNENVPPYQNKPQDLENVQIGYKTGTSIGFKDSWSVGIFDKYILAVWFGNFDGHGNNAFLGRRMSAPLLFNIAYSILSDQNPDERLPREMPPENAIQIPVCSVSGGIPTEDCPHTELAWFIPGVSPITKCKIHRKINIDTRTGYRTDETDKPYVETVVREFWPSDLQQLFIEAGLPRLIPPDYPPEDSKMDLSDKGYKPEIISPMGGTDYVYRTINTSRNKLMLCAVADADTTELLWFEGTNFIGRTKPGESMEWSPAPGLYELTVTDSKGRSDWVNISIIETEY